LRNHGLRAIIGLACEQHVSLLADTRHAGEIEEGPALSDKAAPFIRLRSASAHRPLSSLCPKQCVIHSFRHHGRATICRRSLLETPKLVHSFANLA
jgi:hypothetical protein